MNTIICIIWFYGSIYIIIKVIASILKNNNANTRKKLNEYKKEQKDNNNYNIQQDNNNYSIQQDNNSNITPSQPINNEYDEYLNVTHTSYYNLMYDKGKMGEYKLYQSLRSLPGYKKFLFNCYIPKYNLQTTEIDIIMIHQTGIYVFESKNYGGWIFGNENQENWTQTLYVKYKGTQKNHFFNPISQNNVHIKWLKNSLSDYYQIKYFSYIVFGNECELKKISLTSNQHKVVKRENIYKSILSDIETSSLCLTEKSIDNIYSRLYKYTQTSTTEKNNHIKSINSKYNV